MIENGDSVIIRESKEFNGNEIFVLPYIRHCTKELELILKKKYNLKVFHNFLFKLDGIVEKAKDKIDK